MHCFSALFFTVISRDVSEKYPLLVTLNSPKETSTYFSKISSVVSSLNTLPIAGILDSISSDILLKSETAKTTYRITRIIDKTILVIKPIKAPLPADLARLGFFPSYMRKRIKPTIGIKNPKIANPKLELSSEIIALDLLSIRAPQLLQYDEVSSTILPQFLQYILTILSYQLFLEL